MWVVFAVVFAAGVLISRMIKNGAKNGIEADAVVSRIPHQVQSEDENQCETGLMVLGDLC